MARRSQIEKEVAQMYKACSRCGKIHDTKTKCKPTYKTPYKTEQTELRATNKWHTKSLQIRKRSKWLCAICQEEGRYTYDNLEVHHIISLKQDKSKLLDDYNLVCLCNFHHRLADEGKISVEHLLEIARIREDGA